MRIALKTEAFLLMLRMSCNQEVWMSKVWCRVIMYYKNKLLATNNMGIASKAFIEAALPEGKYI